MIKKIRELIEKSVFKGDEVSSSRIFSYVMMLVILLLGLTHVGFEIGNAIIEWKNDVPYVPSWQSITIIGMWLAHQLTLLGIYKNAEQPISADKMSNLISSSKKAGSAE